MNRSGFDRRLEEDRRDVYDLNYFEAGGVERRRREERRHSTEKRSGWQRVSHWSSVPVGDSKKDLRLADEESASDVRTYIIN